MTELFLNNGSSKLLKKFCEITKLSSEDAQIFLSLYEKNTGRTLRAANSEMAANAVLELEDEDRHRGVIARKLYYPKSYLEVLGILYEKAGDNHYQSRYIQYRTNCPYHSWCTLTGVINTKPPWLFEGFTELIFPEPYIIFGRECYCEKCCLNCDICGKKDPTINRNLVVHHYSYKYPPYSVEDWYKYYGILCKSCNNKSENQVRQKEEEEEERIARESKVETRYDRLVKYFKDAELIDDDKI